MILPQKHTSETLAQEYTSHIRHSGISWKTTYYVLDEHGEWIDNLVLIMRAPNIITRECISTLSMYIGEKLDGFRDGCTLTMDRWSYMSALNSGAWYDMISAHPSLLSVFLTSKSRCEDGKCKGIITCSADGCDNHIPVIWFIQTKGYDVDSVKVTQHTKELAHGTGE